MKKIHVVSSAALLCAFCLMVFGVRMAHSQGKIPPGVNPVRMVITDQAYNDGGEVPVLKSEDLQVKVGDENAKIVELTPAQGNLAALQLFILIDDACEPHEIGNNLSDLREFINAQPASTMVGIAYMSNATIQVAQNLTNDHGLAANALRLPRGSAAAKDSPYLSLISLVRAWPDQSARRQVLMVTDGIDRLRGDTSRFGPGPTPVPAGLSFPPASAATPPSRRPLPPSTPPPRSVGVAVTPTIPVDANTASELSQQNGIIVHSIYSPGVGRLGRNAWEAQLGQSGIAMITDETGGEYFALGTQKAVSFKPFLERLQKIFSNQYFLVLHVPAGKQARLQRVRISSEVPNADIAAANNVWVPAAGS